VPWWFVVPGLSFYLFVIIVPAVRGGVYAFTSWNGLGLGKFVGLSNFRAIIHDSEALTAIRQTIYLTVMITVGTTVIGLLLALGVRSKLKGRNIYRVLLFAPCVVAPVMTAFLWQYILSPFGALNSLLADIGLSTVQPDWLGSPTLALWSVAGVIIWQFSGYSMVIFLAGLEAIPSTLVEAAHVDGAGTFARFRHVILPLLAPALIINVMLSAITGLKQFDTVWNMTDAGPGDATQTLGTLLYQDAFVLFRYGYGISIAVVMAVLVMVVSLVLYRGMSRWSRVS
jgi:raffinose/stachyose/melibiose transport system permease protein